jgi:hypothetical protein
MPHEQRKQVSFWWVNQNQTARFEVGGGYMWSPKRNRNGARNVFYENMKECAPGDIVFSFVDTKISTIGTVTSFFEESPRPSEFGAAGNQWDADGWRVNVNFSSVNPVIRPSEHMESIRPTLPGKYSPIQPDGRGNQVYLARVPAEMADVLIGLIGDEARAILSEASTGRFTAAESAPLREKQEELAQVEIESSKAIDETEKLSLIKSRRGQGLFRQSVASVEPCCRITRVSNPTYLVASHIKPWSRCTNEERLDGENGLMLAPSIDHLFDGGFISFDDDGSLLISPVADTDAMRQMGLPLDGEINVGVFTDKQRHYLEYHRNEVFKKAGYGKTPNPNGRR